MSPASGNPDLRRNGILIASAGVLVLSFDALLIRLAATSEWNVVFWRGWLMMLSITCVILASRRPVAWPQGMRRWCAAAAISVLYGFTATLFVYSVSHTHVANTVVILASAPLFAALFSWLLLRERIARRTLVAIAVAIAGVVFIFVDALGALRWRGDLAALVLAVTMGGALTLLRRFPELPRLPLIAASGAVAGLIALPLAQPLSLTPESYFWLAVMGLVQIPLATGLVMTATRHLPSPEVGLFLLIETVLGPLWVWLVIGEAVPRNTLLGGVLIIGTIALNSWLALRAVRRATRRAG